MYVITPRTLFVGLRIDGKMVPPSGGTVGYTVLPNEALIADEGLLTWTEGRAGTLEGTMTFMVRVEDALVIDEAATSVETAQLILDALIKRGKQAAETVKSATTPAGTTTTQHNAHKPTCLKCQGTGDWFKPETGNRYECRSCHGKGWQTQQEIVEHHDYVRRLAARARLAAEAAVTSDEHDSPLPA